MKKTMFLFALSFASLLSFAQSEKYVKAMETNVMAIDTTRTTEGYINLANAFERIATAEKTQWLPYYYAALAHTLHGLSFPFNMDGGSASKTDPIASKAEELLNKAEELSKDNSEIFVVRKMIATLRMMADPMNRYMEYGPVAAKALEAAQKLNPDNPRVYVLMGQDKFYTPEQYGGSKEEAKKLFAVALQKFDSFKPATNISPNWGRPMTLFFISQSK